MNRQQRRIAHKRYSKEMTKASRSPQPVDASMGTVQEQMKQPEMVAQLTVAEATEIKERKRLIEKEAERLLDEQKVLQLLRMEQQRYLQSLITGKGLSLADDFNLDAEAGVIWRTARAVPAGAPSDAAAPVNEVAEVSSDLVEV